MLMCGAKYVNKLIYLILAHKEVSILNKLITALHCENVEIYVHVDLKSDIDISEIDQRVHLIKQRISVYWGEFSMVQATINSIREINEKEFEYSHIVLLSGQCYPIQSNEKIKKELSKNVDYMNYTALKWQFKMARTTFVGL